MDTGTPRAKRNRSISSTSSSSAGSSSSSTTSNPNHKYHRSSPSPLASGYVCNLPPTCNVLGTPTTFPTLQELERHQESFHRYICYAIIRDKDHHTMAGGMSETERRGGEFEKGKGKVMDGPGIDHEKLDRGQGIPTAFAGGGAGRRYKECGKVFPDQRLLQLHQIEVHDPIAKEKQQRGQKIFQCFLPVVQCGRIFLTPTKRRRHLIDKHRYPSQYFFGITNHGLNKLAEEDGIGVSLIRPRIDHPPRPMPEELQVSSATQQTESDFPITKITPPAGGNAVSSSNPRHGLTAGFDHLKSSTGTGTKSGKHESRTPDALADPASEIIGEVKDVDMDELTDLAKGLDGLGMRNSLDFVPRGVQKRDKSKMAG